VIYENCILSAMIKRVLNTINKFTTTLKICYTIHLFNLYSIFHLRVLEKKTTNTTLRESLHGVESSLNLNTE
jgi:hypothetical protein